VSHKDDFAAMSDDELRAFFDEAKADLTAAARDEPESEWHQSCFAAVMLAAMEAQARGIKLATVH
jgi:HEPN domain-containing protein